MAQQQEARTTGSSRPAGAVGVAASVPAPLVALTIAEWMPRHGLVGRRDADVREARRPKAVLVLGERQRPGDAADVAAALGALGGVRSSVGHDVGDPRGARPARSTRCISANTRGLSVDRLMTQLEITTSTVLAGSGISSM